MAAKAKPYELTVRVDRYSGRRLYGFRILTKSDASRPPWTERASEARQVAERVAWRKHR